MLILNRIKMDPVYRDYVLTRIVNNSGNVFDDDILSTLLLYQQGELAESFLQMVRESISPGAEALLILAEVELPEKNVEDDELPDKLTGLLTDDALQNYNLFFKLSELFAEKERQEDFYAFLAGKKININADRNKDGYTDSVYTMDDGKLTQFTADTDQDGINEIVVIFFEGNENTDILSIGMTYADERIVLKYNGYPYVESASFYYTGEESKVFFAQDVYSYPLVSFTLTPLKITLNTLLKPDYETLEPKGYQSVFRDAESVTRRAEDGPFIIKSDNITIQRLSDGDNVIILRDLDGNGLPEIREIYNNDELISLSMDHDGDGLFEYRYLPREGTELWDFDKDGNSDYSFSGR